MSNGYIHLSEIVNDTLKFAVADSNGVLFRVNTGGDLRETFLDAFEAIGGAEMRQYNNCSCCKKFIKTIGSLAMVNCDGSLRSALWNEKDVDDEYKPVIKALREAVEKGSIIEPYISDRETCGEVEKGGFNHFHVDALPTGRHGHHETAYQRRSRIVEGYRMVSNTFGTYSTEIVAKAAAMIERNYFNRSGEMSSMSDWVTSLFAIKDTVRDSRKRSNLVWYVVATAPESRLHYHNTLYGDILNDLKNGVDPEEIKRRHNAYAAPDKYMRPTAKPSEATIKRAEELVGALGIADSLLRRYADKNDLLKYGNVLWEPTAKTEDEVKQGVFAHLVPKTKSDVMFSPEKPLASDACSWKFFRENVLPKAKQIKVIVPNAGPFVAIVAPVNEDAKPILRWDSEEKRRPLSWYAMVYQNYASDFNLVRGQRADIELVLTEINPDSDFVLIKGCKHDLPKGLGLFPEILRPELHEVRSVIESFSNEGELTDPEGEKVAGFFMGKSSVGLTFVVCDGKTWFSHQISSFE